MASLLAQVIDCYVDVENNGLRVGRIWLHPDEVGILRKNRAAFDQEVNLEIRDHFRRLVGADLEGYLFGAMVFSSEVVPPRHIAILPEGFEARLLDSTATMPIYYDDSEGDDDVSLEGRRTAPARFDREEVL